jgi:hypothetical protein
MVSAPRGRCLGVSSATLVALSLPAASRADDSPPVDTPVVTDDAAKKEIDRTWLYVDDARIAEPLTLIATSSLAFTSVGNSPSRIVDPLPGCVAPCNTYNSFAGNTATP